MRAPEGSHNSGQVKSRHGPLAAYRCFLPDLAGFTGLPCARPDHQRHVTRPAPTRSHDCPKSTAAHHSSDRRRCRSGGEAGIRTRGGVSPTHALQACSFNHSDTSPRFRDQQNRHLRPAPPRHLTSSRVCGGEGGIRTHVGVAPQPAFEAGPLRPLRYLSP